MGDSDTENVVRENVSPDTHARDDASAELTLNVVVIQQATWLMVSEVPPLVHPVTAVEIDLVPPDEDEAAPVFFDESPADAAVVPAAPGSAVCRVNAGVEPRRVSSRLSASALRIPTVIGCS
jgi:hypothetical protein